MAELYVVYLFILVSLNRTTFSQNSSDGVNIGDQSGIETKTFDSFDNSIVICSRCRSHLRASPTDSAWIEARLKITQTAAGTITRSFVNRFDQSATESSVIQLSIRNALFLHQSPCVVVQASVDDGITMNQVKCESEQIFLCEMNENGRSQGGDNMSCTNEEVCWSDDPQSPELGCLFKPVPGTSVSSSSAYAGERIINGVNADIKNHPWSVCLNIGKYTCGGSIISQYLVLTARHCLAGRDLKTTDLHVMMGENTRHSEPAILDKSLYNVIFPNDSDVDLALIKFKKPIQYTGTINAIALPKNNSAYPTTGEWVTVVGWGIECKDPPACIKEEDVANQLQSVKVKVANQLFWQKMNAALVDEPGSEITLGKLEHTFFAGGMTKMGDGSGRKVKKDACSGDSGGAMECLGNGGKTYICGVTSFGPDPPNCGAQPGGYVMIWAQDILSFLDAQIAQERTWTGGITNQSTGGINENGKPSKKPGSNNKGTGQDQDGNAQEPHRDDYNENRADKMHSKTATIIMTLVALKILSRLVGRIIDY